MRVITAVAMVGGYFIAWQGYIAFKARRAAALYEAAEARAGREEYIDASKFAELRNLALGTPDRILNVNNFGIEELNVR
jgi:hypothetical protein